jgi:hypothetical protein
MELGLHLFPSLNLEKLSDLREVSDLMVLAVSALKVH